MPKKTKLLYLIRTWALGGSHTIIRLLLKHLPQDEFQIITVPYDDRGSGNDDFIASVRRQGNDVAPERIPWRSRGNWFRARDTIEELVQRYEIDLIHCHDTHSNVLVGMNRRRYACAAVASPYGWWTPTWHVQAQLYHWFENHVALPRFDRVYTVSQDMKRQVRAGGTPEKKIRVIHTGLDLAQFDGGAPREAVRAAFNLAATDLVVGTVSRLFKEKGHTYLLDALALLKDDCPHMKLLIVGTGDQREALEAQARNLGMEERVVFTDFYDDLPGVLRAMDVFAQPSVLAEGFPTSVLEAQVAGLPVVASDIGGTSETLDVGRTGLLCPPRDARTLAETLRTLARDEERRLKMAGAARVWIERSFTLKGMVAQMADTYREALEAYHCRH